MLPTLRPNQQQRFVGAWYVYTLTDPMSGLVRYVGISSSPSTRLRGHIYDTKNRENTHKSRWIKRLLRVGLRPVLEIVDSGIGAGWQDSEMLWIEKYWRSGILTNSTIGGDNGPFYVSQQTRLRQSAARLGRRHSLEARANMSNAQRGLKKQKPTAEMNDRMSALHPFKNKTHCDAGHPYDEANTYSTLREKNGRMKRACRKCRMFRQRAYVARKRAAA